MTVMSLRFIQRCVIILSFQCVGVMYLKGGVHWYVWLLLLSVMWCWCWQGFVCSHDSVFSACQRLI